MRVRRATLDHAVDDGSEVQVAAQDDQLTQVWSTAVAELEVSPDITPRQLAFVRLAKPLGLLDDTMLLAVGNDLTKDYLETRVRAEVSEALTSALGRDRQQRPRRTPCPPPPPAGTRAPATPPRSSSASRSAASPPAPRRASSRPG
jgi:chromosomal replication initiator protein